MSDRTYVKAQAQQKRLIGSSPKKGLLQRTCACGQHTIVGGECEECRKKRESTLQRAQRAFEPPSAPGAVPGNSPAQENGTSFNSVFDRASRFGHDFSQIPIHSPATGVIQTKLAINKPGDEYEQEADHVSEHVMRMPEPQLQRACACGGSCPKCQTEQPGREHESLQAKRAESGELGQTAVLPIVHEVLRSPGQPLDPATRAFMEPRFGHDFSRVRVHTDAKAAESARAVNALAYTVGPDVVFSIGQFSPTSRAGQQLIAHELTHVVQQSERKSGRGTIQRQKDPAAQKADVQQSSVGLENWWYEKGPQMEDDTAQEKMRTKTNMRRFDILSQGYLYQDMSLLEAISYDYIEEINRQAPDPTKVNHLYDLYTLAIAVVRIRNDYLDGAFAYGFASGLLVAPLIILQWRAKQLLELIEILNKELEKAKTERLEAWGKLGLSSVLAVVTLVQPELSLFSKIASFVAEETADYFLPGPEVSEKSEKGAKASTYIKFLGELAEGSKKLEKVHNIAKGATKLAAGANVLFALEKLSVGYEKVDRIEQLVEAANDNYKEVTADMKRCEPVIGGLQILSNRWQVESKDSMDNETLVRGTRDSDIKRFGYKRGPH